MIGNQIVPFPQLKERLLMKLELATSDKRYHDVVKLTNELSQHGFTNKHVYTSKINALIALKMWEDAEDFCEYVMDQSEEYEQFFMNYYLFVLHESHQFGDLIETYESSTIKGIISHKDDVLVELYESAKYLLASEYRQQKRYLDRAVDEQNHLRQKQILTTLKIKGYKDLMSFYPLLVNVNVHPIVKTELLIWAKNLKLNDKVELEKFGHKMTIETNQLDNIENQHSFHLVLNELDDLQQQNPAQYEGLKNIFTHYCFVIYPFNIPKEEVEIIVDALKYLSENQYMLNDEVSELHLDLKKYIEQILICHGMYLQIFGND